MTRDLVPIRSRRASADGSRESVSSTGYHVRYPLLLMLEDAPLHDPRPLDETEDDDPFAYLLSAEEGDPEDADELDDDDPAEFGERESVLARLARMGDPGSSSIQLEKIPPRFWEQTLAPLHRQQRMWLAFRIRDEALQELAIELATELDMAECDAARARARTTHAALRTGHPLPSPSPSHAAARSTVQVNIRLRRDDHERLAQAAAAVGLRPTTLARSLVLNGAQMILREHGKEHVAPPPRPINTPLRLD